MDQEDIELLALQHFVTTLAVAAKLLTANTNTSGDDDTIRRRRRWVMRPSIPRRKMLGDFERFTQEYKVEDPKKFFNMFRMTPAKFNHLLELIRPHIAKSTNGPRRPITPEERLAATLRFLAEGEEQKSVAENYKLSRALISKIISETCDAIWDTLHPIYLQPPDRSRYEKCEKEFAQYWNFPNCIGALDAKRVLIKVPANLDSQCSNSKGSTIIVLLAACDASYNFTLVDIGSYGGQCDGDIFRYSALGREILEGYHPLPEAKSLYVSWPAFPHVFVADEAFPLLPNLMIPYPCQGLTEENRIYNCRLSRARRVIDNTFGLLISKWKIFLRPINMKIGNIQKVVKASCVLHNYTRFGVTMPSDEVDQEFDNGYVQPGNWRTQVDTAGGCKGLQDIMLLGASVQTSFPAMRVREQFTYYFNSSDVIASTQPAIVPN